MTTVFFIVLALVTFGVFAAVAVGRITGGLDDPASSLPVRGLPSGPLSAADVRAVRFSAALRGYRMDEVDRLVDGLARELERRDAELAALRSGADPLGSFAAAAPPPEPAGWFGTGPIPVLNDPNGYGPNDYDPNGYDPNDYDPDAENARGLGPESRIYESHYDPDGGYEPTPGAGGPAATTRAAPATSPRQTDPR